MRHAARISLGSLILVFASIGGARLDGDTSLEGTWVPVAAELGGESFDSEVIGSSRLVIDGENYTILVHGTPRDRGTLKLNAAVSPKQMDITGIEGPNKGRTVAAIYERSGERLRICYDMRGKPRPAEFRTTRGSQLMLVTYTRAKP